MRLLLSVLGAFKTSVQEIDKKLQEELNEIDELFLGPSLIKREKIILMPQGQTIRELTPEVKRKIAELAVGKGVRFSTRLHIDLYDDLKGV